MALDDTVVGKLPLEVPRFNVYVDASDELLHVSVTRAFPGKALAVKLPGAGNGFAEISAVALVVAVVFTAVTI